MVSDREIVRILFSDMWQFLQFLRSFGSNLVTLLWIKCAGIQIWNKNKSRDF